MGDFSRRPKIGPKNQTRGMFFLFLKFEIAIPLPLFLCLSAAATPVATGPEARLSNKLVLSLKALHYLNEALLG